MSTKKGTMAARRAERVAGLARVAVFDPHGFEQRGRNTTNGEPQCGLFVVEAAQQSRQSTGPSFGPLICGAGHQVDQRRFAALQCGLEPARTTRPGRLACCRRVGVRNPVARRAPYRSAAR
jgi:hypothetical protein